MIIRPQIVKTRWSNSNKEHLMLKGYKFTKIRQEVDINVDDLSKGSGVKVNVECDYCGKILNIPYNTYLKETKNETQKATCKQCGQEKAWEYNETYRKSREKHYNEFLKICRQCNYKPLSTLSDVGKIADTYVKYICPKHGEQQSSLERMIYSGARCSDCKIDTIKEKGLLSLDEVQNIVNSKNNNTLLNPENYKGAKHNNLKIQCGSCGDVFMTSLSSIINAGGRCPNCAKKASSDQRKTRIEEVEKRINSINNNKLLNPNDYVNANTKNLKVLCGSCGKKVFIVDMSHYMGGQNRCSKCSGKTSSGEYLIKSYLDSIGEKDYVCEKRFPNCKDKKTLPFDFYFPKRNLIIEFDGMQHFKPTYGEDRFKYILKHDSIKNDYCEKNGINLVRIPYYWRQYIENIIDMALEIYKEND